jgi:thioredoxin-like negative regulator of GroEL
MIGRARRWAWKRGLALAIAGGLAWGGWAWWGSRRDQMALARAAEDMQAGRYEIASRQLAGLMAGKPYGDEPAYLLGICEKARGRLDAADAAWSRIRPGSATFSTVVLARAELMTQRGRQSDAESLVERALSVPGVNGSDLRWFLVPLYWQEGRVEDAERMVEATWDHLNRSADGYLDQTMKLLQAHQRLSQGGEPVAGFRQSVLEQVGKMATEDDRIWLAQANLAISRGAFAEGAHWLAKCRRRRPEDVPVWNAVLRWAMATSRLAEVREALKHLPAAGSTPAQVDRLAAWLAAHRGDAAAERRALERLVAHAPAELAAWDRLAELTARAGEPDRAAAIRREKSEVDRARDRYQKLFERNQPIRDAAELARLAGRLGRRFEARVFLTLAVEVEPNRADLREELARRDQPDVVDARPGCTLAEVLAQDLEAGVSSTATGAASEVVPPP